MDKSIQKNITKWPPMPFWHYFAELVTEPVLLTLAVVLAYNHFTSTAVWNRLHDLPTGADMAVIILFFGAFIIWALVVVRRLRRESRRDEELDTKFNQIAQSIDRLTDEIRKSRGNE